MHLLRLCVSDTVVCLCSSGGIACAAAAFVFTPVPDALGLAATCRDLGAHIDGWVATQAQTILVQPSFESPVTGQAADVIQAARTAFDAALRLIRPGKKISEVSPVLAKVVEAYGCNLVEGVMSHQMRQFVLDGTKSVLNRPSHEHKVEDGTFEENEVYSVDIVVSTGGWGEQRFVWLSQVCEQLLPAHRAAAVLGGGSQAGLRVGAVAPPVVKAQLCCCTAHICRCCFFLKLKHFSWQETFQLYAVAPPRVKAQLRCCTARICCCCFLI